jgi:hypothetical protein
MNARATTSFARLLRVGAGLSVIPAVLLFAPAAQAATPPLPDPNAAGIIGLCDRNLDPVSSGSTLTQPFVWRAVGATAARGPYAEKGGTATLYAYQPRPQVPASEWSGLQLGSSGHYSNTTHPMYQATGADSSLADFAAEFPPEVNGLLELRLYLGGPDLPLYVSKYDIAFVKITGTTWKVVYGGTVNCKAGTSYSRESIVLPSAELNPTTQPATPSISSPASSSASSGSGAAGVSGAGTAPSDASLSNVA